MAPGEAVAGGEGSWRAEWLVMARVRLCPCCPGSARLGGRNRQGQCCLAAVGRSWALLPAVSSG